MSNSESKTSSGTASDVSTKTEELGLSFAKEVFSNVQELNRTMDQKANNLQSSVALLTAALGIFASSTLTAVPSDDGQRLLKVVGILVILLYLLLAFNVIYVATKVYRARSHRIGFSTTAPGMLFPLILLERYSTDGRADEDAYVNRLQMLEPRDIMYDYSNQIIEVSSIYKEKQYQVNLALERFRWLSILWIAAMLVLVMIIVGVE